MLLSTSQKRCRACGGPIDHVICSSCEETLEKFDPDHACGQDNLVKYCQGCNRPEKDCPCVLGAEPALA